MTSSRGGGAYTQSAQLVLGVVILAVAIGTVGALIRISQYPTDRAAAFRRDLSVASLPQKDRLATEKDLLLYETDSRIKIWVAEVQAVGGLVLLLGLGFTWRNLRATQAKLDIDREGQLTNRFTQATSQLGAQLGNGGPNVEARLGAIYALAWIARDSPADYWPVMEVLTAYVRHDTSLKQGTLAQQALPGEPKPRTDIQAVLTTLGRSIPPKATETKLDHKFDLRCTDLRGAEFWDAHMERTDFWGAHLEGAKMWGTHLEDAKLDYAHLDGANLREAKFKGASLIETCLKGADLRGADFSEAAGLTKEAVESAAEREGVVLPSYFTTHDL